MALMAGVPVLPPVFQRLARLAGVGRKDPNVTARLAQVSYGTVATGSLGIALGWVLMGLSLWAALQAGGYASTEGIVHDMGLCVAAAALAVVAGFLALMPGGAGVREFVLIALLATPFTKEGALVSALVARLVWLVAELLISGILYMCGARK
jgi:uncharacterized membrane protein YbhN (UPF0104 family)